MFTKKYEITLCANKNDVVNELGAMDCLGHYTSDIEKSGSVGHVYTMNDLVFYGFTSIVSVQKAVEVLKKKMYKTDVYAVGGTIFLTFE